jgi:hypothetical protein
MKALSLMLAIVASAIVLLVAAPAKACNGGVVGGGAFSFTQAYSQPFVQQQFVQSYSMPQQVVFRQNVVRQRVYAQPFRQNVVVRQRVYGGGLRVRAPFVSVGW